MGGKHKQAQRTKNNARPSSSGRSAELLGSSIPQFAGFSNIKERPYVFPTYSLAGMDETDTNIDVTFQLVLKKMSKKDSTTKLKALQEFTGLVTSSEQEAVKAVLVFWMRIYCVLATDTEHKVREATQLAHYQVVLKVKRNLAPYLKQLIGPWFTSQYDTYAPAASAAIKSIEDAFPKNKAHEAIVFCQEDILNYIYENLIVHTPQTLNVANVSKEDAGAKYERIVISSLQGYALYLERVDREQIEKVAEINSKIISNQSFWKFYKNEVVPIRNAWYNVLKAICQKVPHFLKGSLKNVVGAVFQNLDESEPTVLFAVWEAALLVITTVENWWTYVSVEKLLLPKLYKVLREAGHGNATMIFPNLLPLLSHLPPNIDIEKFYCGFFDNLQIGLKLKATLASRSESTAICVTYLECLQYIIMKNQSNLYLCEKLIKTELLPTIEWGLIENQSVYKTLFNQTSNLVQYWHRNRNEKDFPNYGKYLEYFWSNIESLFEGLLMNQVQRQDKNALSELALKQIEFLMSLKHVSKPKKHLKVQFTESVTEGSDHSLTKTKDEKFDETYVEALNGLVFKICKLYVNIINEKLSKELVEHLYSIITEFESKTFFLKLNEMINKEWTLINLYQNLISKWLNSGYICTESVVGLVFILLKYTEREEKLKILESFETLPMEHFGWCLQSALSHPHNQDDVIHEWLSNPKVDEYLIKLAEDTVDSKTENDASNLLKMAFTEGKHGELFVSNHTVQKIIQIVTHCLRSPSEHIYSLDNTCSFAAYLCSILYTENNKLKYGTDLLVEIFKLLCNAQYDKETITKDTIWEMQTSVYDSIEILCGAISLDELKEIIGTLSKIIETKLFDGKRLDIDAVYSLILGLIKCVKTADERIYTADIIFEKDFINEWRNQIVEIGTLAEYINGNLSSPTDKINISSDAIRLENLLKFSDYLLLKSKVYSTCLAQFNLVFENDEATANNVTESDDGNIYSLVENIEECTEINDEDSANALVIESSSDDFEVLCYLLHDYTLITTFIENYKTTNIHDQVIEITKACFEHIDTIVKKLDDINEYLLMKIEQNWFWEKTLYEYNIAFKNQSKSGTYKWFINRSKLYTVPWKYVIKDVMQSCEPSTKLPLVEELANFRNSCKSEMIERANELFVKIEEFKSNLGENFYILYFSKWSDIEISIEVLRFCSSVFDIFDINDLDDKHWDFLVVSLASWAMKIPDIKFIYKNVQIQSFIANVCNLFSRVENYLKSPESNPRRSKEWDEVFAGDVHMAFVEIWCYLTEQVLKDVPVKTTVLPFLQHIGSAISHLNYEYIFKNEDNTMMCWSKIVKQCCTLLVNQSSVLQLWGYDMLKVLKPGLVEMDLQTLKSNAPNEKGLIFERFKSVLQKTQEIVHILLSAMKLGEDSCRVQPHTDSYTYTFAYTLLWDFLLLLCETATTDLRFQYAEWLKSHDYLSKLLVHLFKLMPGEVLFYVPSESKIKPFHEYFTKKFELSTYAPTTSATLERIVCWVFSMTMSQLPASVRQWWTDSESRSSQVVERVTSAYVSPQLCSQELTDVAQHETKFRNMVIKIHPTVREVVAIYTVDDIQMDLVITLPTNYPLVGPDVQCNKQIAGTSHKNWLMQLKKCLRYQNGRIWDGLSLWNNSLNKKFDGVEECYICFAVLHQGTYQLPKLSCQTCRKKFHSACLYKWFSTSNKSTCPICRNLF